MSKPKGRKKKTAPKPTMTGAEANIEAMEALKKTGLFPEEWILERFGPTGNMWDGVRRGAPTSFSGFSGYSGYHGSKPRTCDPEPWSPVEGEARKVEKWWSWKRLWKKAKTVMGCLFWALVMVFISMPFYRSDWGEWGSLDRTVTVGYGLFFGTVTMWLFGELYSIGKDD